MRPSDRQFIWPKDPAYTGHKWVATRRAFPSPGRSHCVDSKVQQLWSIKAFNPTGAGGRARGTAPSKTGIGGFFKSSVCPLMPRKGKASQCDNGLMAGLLFMYDSNSGLRIQSLHYAVPVGDKLKNKERSHFCQTHCMP
ncbi:hypothetical protein BaRGS_00018622 [Batillaria attramentaria]|uniref:Uncharacterized protein n=1 Tax=Batillaria attramentaria TaxID=370345 RepID=A0ABD0KSH4_9CAEN